MAKNNLLGGSLWQNYSDEVSRRMNNPENMGVITEEEAAALNAELIVADHGAESCGDAVRLFLAVAKDSGKILKARFKSFGCGTAIAASDMMAELCIGKTVDEAAAITNLDVEKALRDNPDTPAVPPQKMHCSVMAYDVIKKAAALYKGVDESELDQADIVCECARVTLSTIQEVIRLNDLKTVEEITAYTKAGAFCKSCIRPGGHETRKWYLEDILRETRARMQKDAEAAQTAQGNTPFSELSSFRQFKAVETVLKAEVLPALHRDGGGLEVEDFSMDGDVPVLTVSYKGACLGCSSATAGTLGFIENILRERLDAPFRVEVG